MHVCFDVIQTDERKAEQADEQTDGGTNKQTEERTDGRTNIRSGRQMNKETD